MSAMEDKLTEILAEFVGKEVLFDNNPVTVDGTTYDRLSLSLSDTTVTSLRQAFAAAGIDKVALRLPGAHYTEDYDPDRVEVDVEQDTNGKWRIAPVPTFG